MHTPLLAAIVPISSLPVVTRRYSLMIRIKVRKGESIHSAIRRFRDVCGWAFLRYDFVRTQFFVKPSDLRRWRKFSQKRNFMGRRYFNGHQDAWWHYPK